MSATQKQLLISGIAQLVIGGFCMIFGIIERATTKTYRGTITSIPCLGIWMGLWIGITGLLGVFTKTKTSFKPLVGVYLGFSITSIVFAAVMIICYSLSIAIYYDYDYSYYSYRRSPAPFVMSVLILILSIVEFGVGIWASVCCCVTFCGQPSHSAPAGQVVYMQTQGGPPAAYVIVQGPDGTPVAVPAQAGGPMIEMSGTPVYNQTGAVPPHYSAESYQQPPQNQEKVPI